MMLGAFLARLSHAAEYASLFTSEPKVVVRRGVDDVPVTQVKFKYGIVIIEVDDTA